MAYFSYSNYFRVKYFYMLKTYQLSNILEATIILVGSSLAFYCVDALSR